MPEWKRGGYVIRLYLNDPPPPHVHVFKERVLVARFDLQHRVFMSGSNPRHFGRVEKALRDAGLI